MIQSSERGSRRESKRSARRTGAPCRPSSSRGRRRRTRGSSKFNGSTKVMRGACERVKELMMMSLIA